MLGKSVRFTFRSKLRFMVFIIIFAITSSFVAFFIDGIDELRTDEFLDQKGVELKEVSEFAVNFTQGLNIEADILGLQTTGNILIEDNIKYLYYDLDPSLRMFSIDITKPWMSRQINPSLMESGRFPSSVNEIMIPNGSFQIWNSSNNVTIKSDIVIGQTLVFENDGENIELLVVGTFNNNEIAIPLDINSELWLVVDITTFEAMVELYDGVIEDAFVNSMSFTVPGNILTKSTYYAIDELNEAIKVLFAEQTDNSIYGTWYGQQVALPTQEAIKDANFKIVSLQYAILGGILLSTLFAYLISRFRRNEVAILKAMGYANKYVRATLIGEILTTSFVGFILGLGTAQAILFTGALYDQSGLLSIESIVVSFGLIVVISIPGMILVSQRILGISPAEAFRTK